MKTKWSLLEKKSKLTPFDIPIDYNILNILANRGITEKNDIIKFIHPKLENLEDPFGLIDLDLAIKKIEDAINNNLKICIYGDYDVDGITSTSLLYLSLKKLGSKNLTYYIPLRNEGYGLNKSAIDEIKKNKTDLIITVDCGITSYNEVEYIKELGMSIIITDHHDLSPNSIPKAHACINPKRTDNKYTFPSLAGVGVVFMLILAMFEKHGIKDDAYNFLDIVTLGTIADIMPLIKENRILVKYGLEKLKNTTNLGIRTILKKLELENKELTSGDVSFKISPILNAVGRLSDAKLAVKLLISESQVEINALADNLISNNINRKKIQDEIVENLIRKIDEYKYHEKDILIFSSPDFHHGIIGIVASKVLEKYYKPSIIIEENLDEGIAVGSCRSIEGFNITKALSFHSKLLIKFGGHANAAGFTIKLENLTEFKNQMEKYAHEELKDIELVKNINIDMKIPAQKISYEFIQSLNLLKPFGFGNSTPILMTENCIIHNPNLIGANKNHLKFDIDQKGFSVRNAIWFNQPEKFKDISNEIFYDIVFKLETSEFNDRFYPNILIEDMKKSKLKDDKLHFYHSMFYTSFPIKSVFYTVTELNLNDKLYIKSNFSNYSVMLGRKTISKLDTNISNLLNQLNYLYNYEFEIKLEDIEKRDKHNICHILIKRKYLLENYSNSHSVQFRNIKNFLLKDLEYNEFTKISLSKFYKENKSIHINKKNINIEIENKKISIKLEYLYNLLITVAMKYYYENDKKINFYTKNKYFTELNTLKPYCNFIYKIDINNKNDVCIFDFNTINLPIFKLNFDKVIILYDEEINLDKLESIEYNLKLPLNILGLKGKLKSNINTENVFLNYLPINDKKVLLELAKNGKIIYTDNSIIDYY